MYGNEINRARANVVECIRLAMTELRIMEENHTELKGVSLGMNAIRVNIIHKFPKVITEVGSDTLQMLSFCEIMLMLIKKVTQDEPLILGKLLYELAELKEYCRKEVYQIPKVKENVSN